MKYGKYTNIRENTNTKHGKFQIFMCFSLNETSENTFITFIQYHQFSNTKLA
jgi:hypothetical protein